MSPLPPTASAFVPVLTKAAANLRNSSIDRPAAAEVVLALLQAEKTAKQTRLVYPMPPLLGNWQLCFTAPRNAHFKGNSPVGKGFYVPHFAPAQISFLPQAMPGQDTDAMTITNQVQVGGLTLRFTGPAKYLGKKNLLAFDFTQWQLSWGDRPLFSRPFGKGKPEADKTGARDFCDQPIAKLPFFAFFLVTETFIAARGRGGGLALWVRV